MILHREVFTKGAFTHRSFYTGELLHTEAFTQTRLRLRSFYTEKSLHRGAVTHRSFHTQKLLHRGAFYTQTRSQKLLHREVFTQRSVYRQMLLHRGVHRVAFTHKNFYTQTRLVFTHNLYNFSIAHHTPFRTLVILHQQFHSLFTVFSS